MGNLVAWQILLVAVVVVLSTLLRYGLLQVKLPALFGYFLLGFLLRLADEQWQILDAEGHQVFAFLAEMGVVVLLFRVGLESRVARLLKWLPRASIIFSGDVLISGLFGYVGAFYLLGWPLIPSLFVAVALTATSVGVSVAVWQEAGALKSPSGELMLDVAELDDLSGVLLMALIVAIAPVLHGQTGQAVFPLLGRLLGAFTIKLAALGAFCVLFARYAERHVTAYFRKLHAGSGALLVVLGIGIMVAAGAELLGFSVAIGAFFAGLIFSRDPESVKLDVSFESLHDLFAPFFFVGIGLQVDPGSLTMGIVPFIVLLGAAVAGKVIGNGGTTWLVAGTSTAVLLGVSMVPRAEIALIIMQRGLELGAWAVSPDIYAGMVMVSAMLTLSVPFVLRFLFARSPQAREVT